MSADSLPCPTPSAADGPIHHLDHLAWPLSARGVINPDLHLTPLIAQALGLPEQRIAGYRISHRSLDARQRQPCLRYRLEVVEGPGPGGRLPCVLLGEQHPLYQLEPQSNHPRSALIVGSGPAGLMAGLLLALHGCRPLIIDRGRPVGQRAADIAALEQGGHCDPDSNYRYGAGGAGTFSDGKLYSSVRDIRARFVTEALVAAGAPQHILYHHEPHIGSDILPTMVSRLQQRIISLGGAFLWQQRVVAVDLDQPQAPAVVLADGRRLDAPCLILATGHGDRDLLRHLVAAGLEYSPKPYQIGCRIEHPQTLIDRCRLHDPRLRHQAGAAFYRLSVRPGADHPGAASFCMCPGGSIIPAATADGHLCTNGMSRYRRAGTWANAALICTQPATGLAALDRLDALEQQAWAAGGGGHRAPAQSAPAFLVGRRDPDCPPGSYPCGMRPARLDHLLDDHTRRALAAAIRRGERLMPGYLAQGLLVGLETGISSPLRFVRQPVSLSSSVPGVYLAGEGAGQAGGIMSAAIDGLRVAEAILTATPT